MKKILFSIMIIAVVAAVAVGGTVAFFQATSNDVTAAFRTASVSLAANGDSGTAIFDVYNMVPGQSWTKNVYISNTGGADLWVTPSWNPVDGNGAIDKAMVPLVIGTVSGAADYRGGAWLVKAGAYATFPVTLTFKDDGDQSALQGSWITYAGKFVGSTTAP